MGIFDDIKGYGEKFDPSAEKMPKGFGFDPDACEGCPNRGDESLKPCGLCGCPTIAGLLMDRRRQPPAECPRLDEHRGK